MSNDTSKKPLLRLGNLNPKKKSILDHLEGAKKLLDGITSATGLVTVFTQAAKIVGGLFI